MTVKTFYDSDTLAVKPSKTSAVLNGLLTILWWASWLSFGITVLLFIVALLAHFGVKSTQSVFNSVSPFTIIFFCIGAFVAIGALLIIIKQLRRICHTLLLGDPFVPENARRLRIIWIAVAVAEAFRLLSGVIIPHVHKTTQAAKVSTVTLEPRFYVWFLVLALMVLAEVFREGTRLRYEQKLTI
ncbi:MAG: DUF2975 domain-containing protein [Robiginitomaculum sp.]